MEIRASDELLTRLAASDDPVLAYKAGLVAGLAVDSSEAERLRARIAGSSMAAALLRVFEQDEKTLSHVYRKSQGPHWTLVGLAMIDYPPGEDILRPLMHRIGKWVFSKHYLTPPWTAIYPGQEDRVRRCASQDGNAIWYSVRLGLEEDWTQAVVDRLIGWQWPDGGWNCDKRLDVTSSSFQETVIPARGLWAYGSRHDYEPALRAADRAAELLLSHRLLWRRSDGPFGLARLGRPAGPDPLPYAVLRRPVRAAGHGRDGPPRRPALRRRSGPARVEAAGGRRLPAGRPHGRRPSAVVVGRGTYADWGPGGRTRANPLVSLAALEVMRAADAARANSA